MFGVGAESVEKRAGLLELGAEFFFHIVAGIGFIGLKHTRAIFHAHALAFPHFHLGIFRHKKQSVGLIRAVKEDRGGFLFPHTGEVVEVARSAVFEVHIIVALGVWGREKNGHGASGQLAQKGFATKGENFLVHSGSL